LFTRDETDGFDFRAGECHRTVMRMNPEPVFLNGIELMLDNLRSALMAVDYQPGKRVVVAPHQPSAKLLKALKAAARAEYPDLEFLNNLEFYGNTISSSVPTLLSRIHQVVRANELPALQEGDNVILLAAGICMKEIANHMSAGHACLTWQPSLLNSVQRQQVVVGTSVQ
jgi:3-oxoacyl-[acyl-carrier-protein] synthase III